MLLQGDEEYVPNKASGCAVAWKVSITCVFDELQAKITRQKELRVWAVAVAGFT